VTGEAFHLELRRLALTVVAAAMMVSPGDDKGASDYSIAAACDRRRRKVRLYSPYYAELHAAVARRNGSVSFWEVCWFAFFIAPDATFNKRRLLESIIDLLELSVWAKN